MIRLHQFLPATRANGPGVRAGIWAQGCSLGCPGCFNPETHPFESGEAVPVAELFERVTALGAQIQGITLSGGEPFQQREAVTAFLQRVKQETDLSVIVFTGFTMDEILRMPPSASPDLRSASAQGAAHSPHLPFPHSSTLPLSLIDVLIAGRYDQSQHVGRGMLGSANQRIHFLTDRYTEADLQRVPPAEVIISPEGEIQVSGIDPLRLTE